VYSDDEGAPIDPSHRREPNGRPNGGGHGGHDGGSDSSSNSRPGNNGGGGTGPPNNTALTPAAASAPSRISQKERDRNAAEFLKSAQGGNGQTEQTDFVSKTPGDMKTQAASIIKKSHLSLIYDSKHPGLGRKNLLDMLAELGIDTGSFVAVFTLDKTQKKTFEADIQKVANAVRDGDIEVKSRGAETTLLQGRNPCSTATSRCTRLASVPAQEHLTV
jgi:hypothetical protein